MLKSLPVVLSSCLLTFAGLAATDAAVLTFDSASLSSFQQRSAFAPPSSSLILSDADYPGFVFFSGDIDGWSVSLALGTVTNGANSHDLSLTVGATSNDAGQLNIQFTEDFFGALSGTALTRIGGVVAHGDGNSLNYHAYSSAGDFANVGFESGHFDYSSNQSISLLGAYFLTQEVAIVHERAGTSSFDATVNAVGMPDSGSTLILMAFSFLGLEVLRRKYLLALP